MQIIGGPHDGIDVVMAPCGNLEARWIVDSDTMETHRYERRKDGFYHVGIVDSVSFRAEHERWLNRFLSDN